MQLLWTPRARRQRHEAIEYIAQDNPGAALQQLDRIEEQTDMLLVHPELGRPGRKQGTRELVISRTPFIVVYRIKTKAQRIELLRLLHGSQQWPPASPAAQRARPQT
jgi:toxin ParE1/3/4